MGVEQLARMLPGGVDFESARGTLRGLTAPELAGALAGIPRPQTLALLGTYLDDASARAALVHVLAVEAAAIAAERHWRAVAGSEASLQLARLAVVDVCLDPRCRACNGVAEIMAGDQRIQCWTCGGTGRARVDVHAVLGPQPFWVERFETVRATLLSWLADGARLVSIRLDEQNQSA
jgi:hypothetical protein